LCLEKVKPPSGGIKVWKKINAKGAKGAARDARVFLTKSSKQ
jgi:hypothetical protein